MTDDNVRMVLDHLAVDLGRARAAYLDKLDAALQHVVDDAYKPARKGRFAEPTDWHHVTPDERLSEALADGRLVACRRGDPSSARALNRTDLREAAERLGLLDALSFRGIGSL